MIASHIAQVNDRYADWLYSWLHFILLINDYFSWCLYSRLLLTLHSILQFLILHTILSIYIFVF